VIGHDSIVTVPRRGYQFVADVQRVPRYAMAPSRSPEAPPEALAARPPTAATERVPAGTAAPGFPSPPEIASGADVAPLRNGARSATHRASGARRRVAAAAMTLVAMLLVAGMLAGAAAWLMDQPDGAAVPPRRVASGLLDRRLDRAPPFRRLRAELRPQAGVGTRMLADVSRFGDVVPAG
jgi:hypothetical protein